MPPSSSDDYCLCQMEGMDLKSLLADGSCPGDCSLQTWAGVTPGCVPLSAALFSFVPLQGSFPGVCCMGGRSGKLSVRLSICPACQREHTAKETYHLKRFGSFYPGVKSQRCIARGCCDAEEDHAALSPRRVRKVCYLWRRNQGCTPSPHLPAVIIKDKHMPQGPGHRLPGCQ